MRIDCIFASVLFSFTYKDSNGVFQKNEYDRLMDVWTDVNYLREYGKNNNINNLNKFVKDCLRNAERIQDVLEDLVQEKKPLQYYFKQLNDYETSQFKILSFQKGKMSKLRLYAIKIDNNCFVITGGAIKMSQKMQDHPDTNNELKKLKKAKSFLEENDVINEESFFEFLDE